MSKEIEKEVRYIINDDIKNNIINNCEILKNNYFTVDVVVGLKGFDSLSTYGYIVRIRDKGNKIYVENKKMLPNGDFEEAKIPVNDIKTPLVFFMNMGYYPYLVIERERMELKYKNLKIFIDNITLLGLFVEIEYEEKDIEDVKKFVENFKIYNEPQSLYGDIFKEKIKDDDFNKGFNKLVKKYIK